MQEEEEGCPLPHVYHTVSELAAVTSLRNWTNLKVKVVGYLNNYNSSTNTATLQAVEKPGIPIFIMVDVASLKDVTHLEGSLVMVFGELTISCNASCVTVSIVRECRGLKHQWYTLAMDVIRSRFPQLYK